MKKSRKKWIVILVILAAAILGIFLLTRAGGQTLYSQETATVGTLTTYYNFNGKVEVDQSAVMTAPAEATVKEIYVSVNDVVEKDTRLMRLSDGTVLKAEIAGEITALDVRVDQKVSPGETLAELMDMNSLKVTFKVDEYDLAAVQNGKRAEITIDGSGYTFEAPVTYLNKKATESGDLSYYTATASLTGIDLPENTLPGMQVNVRILNQSVEEAVLLKMDALSFTTHNQAYVLMADGNSMKEVEVEVGINDGTYVEILSGVRGGDTVYYVPVAQNPFFMMGGRN